MAPAGLALVGAAAPRAAGATPQRQGSSAPAAAGTQVTVAVERGPAQPAQQTSGAPATKPVTPASDSEKAILPTANAKAPSTGRDTAPSAPDQPLQTAGTPPQPVLSNARPQAPQPAPVPMQPPPLVEQVAAGIRQAADGQVDHIRIELKPASLGAIEVRLDLKHDGSVAATVTADRPDTLAMLHHDAHGLEQALKDAGLRTDPGSLSFNLRGGGSQPGQQQFQQQQPMPRPSQTYAGPQGRFPDEPPRNPSQPAAIVSRRRHPGALDIRI
jgi:flagellar hook-length control protein FliK